MCQHTSEKILTIFLPRLEKSMILMKDFHDIKTDMAYDTDMLEKQEKDL